MKYLCKVCGTECSKSRKIYYCSKCNMVKKEVNKLVKVLSLFDGISAGQVALTREGYIIEVYYASEIEKQAIQVTQDNYPNTVQIGNILEWKSWSVDFSGIDLVLGGFPCQPWGLSGKQLGVKDERGKLFWTMLDIIKAIQIENHSVEFLIENVKMKREFENYITELTSKELGLVHKTLINSNRVCAQNRRRFYWTSKPVSEVKEVEILLTDILETGEFGFENGIVVRASVQKHAEHTYNNKAPTLTAAMGMGGGNVPLMAIPSVAEKFKGLYLNTDDRKLFRRFTPLECERLQTLPDNYTSCVANSHRYKSIGNSWTVDVISHILKDLLG